MIFDQNKEKFQPYTPAWEPREKAKPMPDKMGPGSDGRENNPPVTVSNKPGGSVYPSMGSAEMKTEEQPKPAPASSPLKSAEQANPAFGKPLIRSTEQVETQPDPLAAKAAEPSKATPVVSAVTPAGQAHLQPILFCR